MPVLFELGAGGLLYFCRNGSGKDAAPGLSPSHYRVSGSSRSHNFSMSITDAPPSVISLCLNSARRRGPHCPLRVCRRTRSHL